MPKLLQCLLSATAVIALLFCQLPMAAGAQSSQPNWVKEIDGLNGDNAKIGHSVNQYVQDRHPEALEHLTPTALDFFKWGAICRDREQNVARAMDFYGKALALAPKSAGVLYCRADLLSYLNRYDEAISDCTEAITEDPKLSMALKLRAFCYFQKHEYQKGLADCNALLKADSNDVCALEYRASAYRLLNAKAYADGDEQAIINSCTAALQSTRLFSVDDPQIFRMLAHTQDPPVIAGAHKAYFLQKRAQAYKSLGHPAEAARDDAEYKRQMAIVMQKHSTNAAAH